MFTLALLPKRRWYPEPVHDVGADSTNAVLLFVVATMTCTDFCCSDS